MTEHEWADGDGESIPRYPQPLPAVSDKVRAPIQHGYTASEIVDALPRSHRVDITAIPAALRQKARQHGDDLTDILRSERLATTAHPVHRAALIVKPWAGLGAVVCGITAVLPLILNTAAHYVLGKPASVDVGHIDNPMSYIAAGFAAVWALCTLATTWSKPQWVYTDVELAQLDNALDDWPAVPEDLDSYPNGEVLRREWHHQWMARIMSGGPALVWREPHLVAVANLIARDINSSPAWNSDLFDVHRLRIDLDRISDDIRLRAHRVWRARANLVPPPTRQEHDVVALRNADITDAAHDAWNSLVEVVRQLLDYKNQLGPIDGIVAEIAALELSASTIPDTAVRQLFVDAAGNSLQNTTVRAAVAELRDLHEGLQARLGALRQALATPSNALAMAIT